ncbi:MAG: glycine--tRNA ligase subunit beta, partial [Acidobacteriota bacterium]
IRWPKMMRWGDGSHSWIRPVHSVVSVFDRQALPIRIFGIDSGMSTRGHRILSPGKVEVHSFDDYVQKLGAAHVVVDASERERMMKQRARGLAEQVGGEPATDATIWDQWRYLSEFPGLIRAEFDEALLTLPDEVLVTVMRVHQKQLPVVRGQTLTNSFLAVMDQVDDPEGNIASGNSFVTNARFADARFFYETDRRRTLEDRLPDLAHLQFQEKLGNYRDKTNRIVAISASLAEGSGLNSAREDLLTAARLCKTDLMTEMVKEFTELQGKIGGIYAREEGMAEPVWTAICDHYLPAGAADPLPRSAVGALVSLSDRIDTLAGFFLVGLKPTGSRDPFALRRAAQGAVQILANRADWEIPLNVEQLVDAGLAQYHPDGAALQKARSELLDFLAERVKNLFEGQPFSFAYDEVASAMAVGWMNSLTDLHDRIVALRAVRNAPDFLSLLDSARRIANITAGASPAAFRRDLLQDPAEKRLADLADLAGEQIDELVAGNHYQAALESFSGLAPELEHFFEKVMVVVDDAAVRDNRMALLRQVGTAVRKIADVTKIVVDRSNYTREK